MSLDHLKTIDVAEFARILKIKPRSLHARLSRQPGSLPRPVQSGHGKRLLWLESDVRAWLRVSACESRTDGCVGNEIEVSKK